MVETSLASLLFSVGIKLPPPNTHPEYLFWYCDLQLFSKVKSETYLYLLTSQYQLGLELSNTFMSCKLLYSPGETVTTFPSLENDHCPSMLGWCLRKLVFTNLAHVHLSCSFRFISTEVDQL